MPFQILLGDLFGVSVEKIGDTLGSGSFQGQFGGHFRVGDQFEVGIISGAVQTQKNVLVLHRP